MADRANSKLGAALKARRRIKRLTLRDLSAEIGVSFNTLSRVERGHIPDLRNFQRIIDWLEMPAEAFTEADGLQTTEVIARHLRSDRRLTEEAATEIASMVEQMYRSLVAERSPLAIHLRSAKTFTPAAGALLAEILGEMQAAVLSE
jgi:transcriptional regulator with XRE-family HTH domain